MHDFPLLTTLAAGFTAAWVLGIITQRLGLSPIVGYILAGVVIGPYTPGFVGDAEIATQLAEIGVILLMFGVGLHFHFKDLLAVRNIAIPGAIFQSLVATLLGAAVFSLIGFPLKAGLVLGMAMAVASTVVLIRVLMDNNALDSAPGHAAVGWLIVEDIFTVILLVLIPTLAVGPENDLIPRGFWSEVWRAAAKLGVLVGLFAIAGTRVIPWMLVHVARLRSRELFTLTVLVVSIAVATAASVVFGTSVALGAFLAGMVVAQSPVSQQAAADALPMRDAFAVLFFVAVGVLFRPTVLIEHPGMLLAGLAIVMLAKPLAALLVVAVLGHPARTALTVAVGLAQIGEFSFILSDLARKHGIMPAEGHDVLVATAIVSITLNPLLFRYLERFERFAKSRPRLWRILNGRAEREAREMNAECRAAAAQTDRPLAVVVGYGPVGAAVDRLVRDAGLESVVIDLNLDTIRNLQSAGRLAIFGDASRPEILREAQIEKATHLLVTLPHSADRGPLVSAARELNPELRILVRARYLGERAGLQQAGATAAIFEEAEAAIALAEILLTETGADQETIQQETERIREELSGVTAAPAEQAMAGAWRKRGRRGGQTPAG